MEEIKRKLLEKDIRGIIFFNIKLKCNFFDKTLPIFTYLGGATITILVCLILISSESPFIRLLGTESIISLFVSHIAVHVLKNSIRRKRPKDEFKSLNKFNVPLDCYSFPSGHSTAVFSLATTLTYGVPIFGLLFFPLACIISISRIYLGVHYPSDVIAGISIGAITSTAVHFL